MMVRRSVKYVNINGNIEQKGKHQGRVELDFDKNEILNLFIFKWDFSEI